MSEKECKVKVECSQEQEEQNQQITNTNNQQNPPQGQSHKYGQIMDIRNESNNPEIKLTRRESIDAFNSTSAGTMTGTVGVLPTSCSDIDRYDDTGCSVSDRMQNLPKSTKKKISKISKTSNTINSNYIKVKNRKKCGSICKTIERQSHAKRLDFDFTIFDSLIYAAGMSPLSMAGLHKSLVSYELFRQPNNSSSVDPTLANNLLRITFDSTDKPKTPISLIIKKLISDSHPSAKALCESLHYFHILLKKFRSIRKNNSSKIMIFSQLMPILPRSEELQSLLQTSPEIPSITATYTINAKKGRISLTHYTFNEQLAILLGYSSLPRLKQFIQVQQQLPTLSIPKDYYYYIMECLLNKFQSKETIVDMNIVTFDGIRIDVQERIISRSFIENDVTPEMINLKKEEKQEQQQQQDGTDGEGQGQDGFGCDGGDEEDDDDDDNNEEDDDEDDSNGPQGILLVMSKHFFTVPDKAMESYLFSKERLAICEEIIIPPAISKSQFNRFVQQVGNNSSKSAGNNNNNNHGKQPHQMKTQKDSKVDNIDQQAMQQQQQLEQHNMSCLNGVSSCCYDGAIVKKEEEIDEKDRFIENQLEMNERSQDKGNQQKFQQDSEEDKQVQKRCKIRNILPNLS